MALYAIVFIVSIIKFKSYKNSPLKILPLIFGITIFTEYYSTFTHKIFNYTGTFHNIYNFLFVILFYYIYLRTLENNSFKKIIKSAFLIVSIIFIWECFTLKIFGDSFVKTYVIGACLLVVCIVLYFIAMLQSSLILEIKRDLLFWISIGLFLFYIGYLPIKVIRSLYFENTDLNFIYLLLIIQSFLIIIMYLCFLIGFLWMKKK